jgi:uncharacterized protein YdeI (YjbR/CyaY-like superfamily)
VDPGDVTHFDGPDAFRAWLARHHAERDELWVGYWKKGTGRPSLTWAESVDVALCFGWIDGVRLRVDEEAYTIRFTPRRAGSTWSRRNVERYRAMEAQGRVAPAGSAAFADRTEGNSGLYSYEREVPEELPEPYLASLRADEAAWKDWRSRPSGYRRQVIHWILSAKRDSTRERRLAALIEDGAAGRKVKPLRLGRDE